MNPFNTTKRDRSIKIINSVFPEIDCSNLVQQELNRLSEKAQKQRRFNKREQRNLYSIA